VRYLLLKRGQQVVGGYGCTSVMLCKLPCDLSVHMRVIRVDATESVPDRSQLVTESLIFHLSGVEALSFRS
jgi:hypothetical protein